jgi:hypothetical protein
VGRGTRALIEEAAQTARAGDASLEDDLREKLTTE